ncbi:MAG: FkbM family methyltransferase [Aphanothece sp. CMT-3BRIN-NPC111]|jgi:FkbM family methyltransferase|nr:FkbM family methyltransferase [Aphanothece sp. CMT-3BRIN-NPC111]
MSFFISSLKNSGHLDGLEMAICNVGSRKLAREDDYGSGEWGIFAPHLTIYGFDADADACDQANADIEARQVNWTEKHIPLALGSAAREATLYVTNNPMCSSLYPPNESYLQRFHQLREVMKLDFTVEVETTTLDIFCKDENIDKIDFLQVDVQGADLQVLEGAAGMLESSILAITTEVEFSELYINQPLFSDIDTYLRKKGFTLFNMSHGCRTRACSPITYKNLYGQLLWGDAIYLRDLIKADASPHLNTPDEILKLACIADILDFPDYALELLQYLTINYGNNPKYNCANNIIESLAKLPDLVQQGIGSLPVVAKIRDYASGYAVDLLRIE